MDYLLPYFTNETGIEVDVLAVGTGQALEIGRKGDCDVILVHSRSREDEFVAEGWGVHRACIMYNDFLIIGPQSDPAGIKDKNITQAMTLLKDAGELGEITFFSRGDGSGTHSKELELWALIGFNPDPSNTSWYKETGQGMGTTLTVTNEQRGYTLIDRGTWLALKDTVALIELVHGDRILQNPYGAIPINPEKHPNINYDGALKFVGFLTSERGQDLIGAFRKNGEILFHPDFGICDIETGCTTTDDEVAFWVQYNGNYTGPA